MFSRTLTLTLGSLALASLGLVSTADAQTRMRFQGMDHNNDGRITREEWRGSQRSFDVHDWNNDGVLSGNEVLVGAQRDSRWEEADHNANWRERNLSWTRSAFSSLDHNRDNRLTPNEWHFDVETFRRVDRNRDNAINLSEFLGQDIDDDRGDEFQNLDYNRDGRLARNEWHWSNASFNQRDTNRDGVITAQEFDRSGGAPGTIGAIGGRSVNGQQIRVNSQTRWTDTGITVRQGDIIRFQSSGQIQMSDNSSDVAGSAGSLQRRMAPDAPISGVFAGALIGKIGAYSAFAIGDQVQITAPASGQLYLGVNDDYLQDNRGEFVVTMSVDRR